MIKKTVIEQMIGLLRTPIAQRKGINISPDECLIWAGELEKELKSLPERFNLQPKQEWSEEDDIMVRDIVRCLPTKSRPEYNQRRLDWLKSLKDRVQSKQEWSEEDVQTLDRIISNYQYFCMELSLKEKLTDVERTVIGNVNKEDIDWLKSLRPQSRWKPSEEQISALDFAIDCTVYPEFQDKSKVLIELLEQLKKL